MDKYYSDLSRESLSKAHANVANAQDYLVEANAPKWLHDRAARLLSSLRKLQDDINNVAIYEAAQHSVHPTSGEATIKVDLSTLKVDRS